MPLSVVLEDERGSVVDRVEDPRNVLVRLIEAAGPRLEHLRFVDPYGDTVFNRAQMEPVLADLHLLGKEAAAGEEGSLVAALEALAVRCGREPHLYLRFSGD